MSTGTNVGLVHRFYQALQQGDYDTLTGMFHPDFVFYPQIDSPRPGGAGFIDAEKKHVDAFPDVRLTVLYTVAEAHKVGAYVVVEGHQGGDYYGIPPPHARAERTYVFPCSTCSRSRTGRSSRSGPTTTWPTSWTSSRPAPPPDDTGLDRATPLRPQAQAQAQRRYFPATAARRHSQGRASRRRPLSARPLQQQARERQAAFTVGRHRGPGRGAQGGHHQSHGVGPAAACDGLCGGRR